MSDQHLAPGESVLPFAWDGEFYVPLGFSRPTDTGCDIVVERLPEPISTTRSLGGSVRILFRKLVGRRSGFRSSIRSSGSRRSTWTVR